MAKRRKKTAGLGVVVALLGLISAVSLGAVFYGAMVYQLTGEEAAGSVQAEVSGVLALEGARLESEQTLQAQSGGEDYAVRMRTYVLENGGRAQAVTAESAAYLERMANENWTPQLMTGFTIAGLDAVYALRGQEAMLAAHSGGRSYMIICPADERTAYALGSQAVLE